MSAVAKYWHTLRHLRPVQVYGRVWFRLNRPRPDLRAAPSRAVLSGAWIRPASRRRSLTGPDTVTFLNKPGRIATAADWNDAAAEKLWLYNLHYFEDLASEGGEERTGWHRALVARWIAENPACHGNGWEPYPLSLRIVCWIKWLLAGYEPVPGMLDSLAAQTRALRGQLEWHLLGNHLWANAKALVFAGQFFSGSEAEEWRRAGLSVIGRELGEQVLADGGHFELSPMYHSIILEDVLDLINLRRAYGALWPAGLDDRLVQVAGRMRRWLALMAHPDGEISFFNDAATGIASPPETLEAYAERLGLAPHSGGISSVEHLAASGYVRLARGDAVAFLDVAAVGPDYLPGHAHADTLSLELSLGRHRLIVNAGTSVYGSGSQRQYERSTAAHSTVEVDGASSSEVWGGFRVARRARVIRVEVAPGEAEDRVTAAHDGYKRLPGRNVHSRSVVLTASTLLVRDEVSGPHATAVARFHLGAGVSAEALDDGRRGRLVARDGRSIAWNASTRGEIVPSSWHPGFGNAVATQCLNVTLAEGKSDVMFTF